MKLSKTDYRGGEALIFATRALELTVTTAVGPRIVSFRSLAGKKRNLLLEIPEGTPRANGYEFRGGHRLWHAPEDLVRTYQPDDEPLAVRALAHGVALTQPVEAKTGIEKGVAIELRGERTVKVTHRLTNLGQWTIETAPWALTMFKPGGYGVVPLLPKGDHQAGDMLPTFSLVPWSYTDLSLPVWDLHRDFIGIDVDRAPGSQKLGLTNYPGWSAYWNEGATFVKFSPMISGATYPDMGCAFETFTNGKMLELETLGRFGPLAPGRSVGHVEYWTAIDGLRRPDTDVAFAKLAAAVNAWIATL